MRSGARFKACITALAMLLTHLALSADRAHAQEGEQAEAPTQEQMQTRAQAVGQSKDAPAAPEVNPQGTIEGRWSSHLQGYHLTGWAEDDPSAQQELDAQLNAQPEASAPWPDQERAAARAWSVWLADDLRVWRAAARCERAFEAHGQCARDTAALRKVRDARLARALPVWTRVARAHSPEQPAWHMATYYQGVGLLIQGQDRDGLALMRALAETSPPSNYAAAAVTTMADYLFQRGQPSAARALYLRAGTMQGSSLRAYASLMESWCALHDGASAEAALTRMMRARAQVRATPHQLQGEALDHELVWAMMSVFGRAGDGEQGEAFLAALGIPEAGYEVHLELLARLCERANRHGAALALWRAVRARAPQRATALQAHIVETTARVQGHDSAWALELTRLIALTRADGAPPERASALLAMMTWSARGAHAQASIAPLLAWLDAWPSHPDAPHAHTLLASLAASREDWVEAARRYDQANRLAPTQERAERLREARRAAARAKR